MNTHLFSRFAVTGLAAIISFAAYSADGASRDRRVGERCWQDVRVLASDAMEGRRAGSEGHRRAAQFVAAEFRKAGLKPGGEGKGDAAYLQPVQLEMRQIDETGSSLTLLINGESIPLKLGDDAGFLLRGNFERHVEAPLVFVGHGLRMTEHGVDDLAG